VDPKAHWETIYTTKDIRDVSWFQSEARRSLALIARICPDKSAPIIDVGGGGSVLVDGLLAAGYRDVTVLDVSEAALDISRDRLGADSTKVNWLCGDVLAAPLRDTAYALWHDRAVFHFFNTAAEREMYVGQVRRAVRPGGHVLVATFADDGPRSCSGLPVTRYSAPGLHAEFGDEFELLGSEHEEHQTPGGARQSFLYCLCRRQ
jgi:SAM-dependent methyltransferase